MCTKDDTAYPANALPPGCWHNVLQHFSPDALVRAASVNKTFKTASFDNRLWAPHFESAWSPEHYVSPLLHEWLAACTNRVWVPSELTFKFLKGTRVHMMITVAGGYTQLACC
jgi:hypothetical protein